MLLFFVHLRSQQKRTESHLQLSNLQRFHFNIIITALHVMQMRYCDENSVCPSVRRSVCPSVCHTRLL